MAENNIGDLLDPNSPIDKEIIDLLERCPILLNVDFLKTHPGIMGPLGFLHSASKGPQGSKVYERYGVKTTEEYVTLIQNGDEAAIQGYERLRNILCL